MANRVGRPRSGVETKVVAVRIPIELWERLNRHVDLETRQGKGTKASINSMVGYAIENLLDEKEKPQESMRQEQRPSTPAREISTRPRAKFSIMSPRRKKIVQLLQQHPDGLSPVQTKKLLGEEIDLGSTMKSMWRDGLLSRLEIGRYVVAEGVEIS